MTTRTLRWRQSEQDARAALPWLQTFLRTTLIPSALRATLIGALFAAGLRWAVAVLRPDVILPWLELIGGVLAMPAGVILCTLVLLGRRDGGVERVPLPQGVLEQHVLATFAAHAPEQVPTEYVTAAGQELMRALSGLGAVVLYGGIAAYAVVAGYSLAALFRALQPDQALAWVLWLAPLLLGPGAVLAVYARRRHGLPARQAQALALGVNIGAASLAYVFSILFYTTRANP